MSFQSSLVLFLPGRHPLFSAGDLRSFSDVIRAALSLENNRLHVKLCYQNSSGMSDILWDATGMIGEHDETPWKQESWDHARLNLRWEELWPGSRYESEMISRASINLGVLTRKVSAELTASKADSKSPSYIAPSELYLYVHPVCPTTLEGELDEHQCFGGIELSFYGMGYFSWQPLSAYWSCAKQSTSLRNVMQLCREAFPAPALRESFTEHLGKLFLNREDYRRGDWIVSVSESG